MTIYIAIYKQRLTTEIICFFSKSDAEKQVETWMHNDTWQDSNQLSIVERFVYGHNPFLNNQELID